MLGLWVLHKRVAWLRDLVAQIFFASVLCAGHAPSLLLTYAYCAYVSFVHAHACAHWGVHCYLSVYAQLLRMWVSSRVLVCALWGVRALLLTRSVCLVVPVNCLHVRVPWLTHVKTHTRTIPTSYSGFLLGRDSWTKFFLDSEVQYLSDFLSFLIMSFLRLRSLSI